MSMGRPDLQLSITAGADLQGVLSATSGKPHFLNDLRVASIQAFRESQDACQNPHGLASAGRQPAIFRVRPFRRSPAVIPRHQRNDIDFLGLEPSKIAILDEVIRVLVVARVADVHTDVVE
jgi:hypothetical protein